MIDIEKVEMTQEFVEQVAALTVGEGATVTKPHEQRTTWHIKGETLQYYMRAHEYGIGVGRVVIRGLYPGTYGEQPYKMDDCQITCAISRGAEKVAGDINKRFMPRYVPELQRVTAFVKESRANEAQKSSDAQRVAQAVGVPASRLTPNHANRIHLPGTGTVRFDCPGEVYVERLTLPTDLFLKVVDVLKDAKFLDKP